MIIYIVDIYFSVLFTYFLLLLHPQLFSVRICVLIWSLPTRPSTRAPPWEPSPPLPSLSTWTTKQRRGTPSDRFHYITTFRVPGVCHWRVTLRGLCTHSVLDDLKQIMQINLAQKHTHALPRYCHLCSYIMVFIGGVRHGADSASLATWI